MAHIVQVWLSHPLDLPSESASPPFSQKNLSSPFVHSQRLSPPPALPAEKGNSAIRAAQSSRQDAGARSDMGVAGTQGSLLVSMAVCSSFLGVGTTLLLTKMGNQKETHHLGNVAHTK